MKGIEKGIVINITVGTPNVPPPVSNIKKPEIVKDKDVNEGDAFDLELINKNRLDDGELIDLGERISLFARRLLNENKMSILQEFMHKAKDHLGPTILGLVKDEIEAFKENINGK